MISHTEFLARYEREKPMLRAWGEHIRDHVFTRLQERFGTREDADQFVKMHVVPRVKDNASMLGKAFLRNKNYSNPYDEITDKVGLRFVMLLEDDIRIIKEIIEAPGTQWQFREDRNYELERNRNPMLFTYQSVHYILFNSEQMFYNDDVSIAKDTPCEVQIRTLLQHAYSELSHDTVYKPHTRIIPQVNRALGTSVAMIETVDGLFGDVDKVLRVQREKADRLLSSLRSLYEREIGRSDEADRKTDAFILEEFHDEIELLEPNQVEAFVKGKSNIFQKIKTRRESDLLFRQPTILLVYYLLSHNFVNTQAKWPYPENELLPISADLGISLGLH